MDLNVAVLATLLGIFGVAAYIQTLTGFAFGLVAMGAIGLLHAMPLAEAAIIVGILVIANAVQVLRRNHLHVERRILLVTLATSLPLVAVGVWLVDQLSGEQADWLRLILGISILLSSVQLVRQTQRRERPSSTATTLAIAALSGLLGGLFSAAGPPLVHHLYRQPLPLDAIRLTLISTFAVNAVLRLGLVTAQGQLTWRLSLLTVAALPAVMLATWLARRWPPPLSPRTLRVVVFALLALSGLSLGVPALLGIPGHR